MNDFDVLIIGGGAAGCYCAIHAAQLGLSVAILERNHSIGAKIRVSGGGRCNLTNLYIAPEAYLSSNPNFVRSALARHTQWDFLTWLESHHLKTEEKTLGQLFCVQKSRGILAVLGQALIKHQVTVITDCTVTKLEKNSQGYCVESNQGQYQGIQCVIACGGPSFPKLGATDSALHFAKQLQIANIPFRPALVPFTLRSPQTELAGISTEVIVQTENAPSFRENLLYTHRGLSGPAILQISSYWQKGNPIYVDYLPDLATDFLLQEKQQRPRQTLVSILKRHLPSKLAEYFSVNYPESLQHYSNACLQKLSKQLHSTQFYPSGTEGMKKAEVSTGGIDTRQLNPRTFEIKSHLAYMPLVKRSM